MQPPQTRTGVKGGRIAGAERTTLTVSTPVLLSFPSGWTAGSRETTSVLPRIDAVFIRYHLWKTRRPEDERHLSVRFRETGALRGWKWETEIRAHNGLTSVQYVKDYDAIVSLFVEGRDVRFALEYERMAKCGGRQAGVRRLIDAEKELNLFCTSRLTTTC
jgi:hypothetical protein